MYTTRQTMLRLGGALPATLCLALAAVPAMARTSYVNDGAGLLNQSTIQALNTEIGSLNDQTGKEVVVVTVPTLGGQTLNAAAGKTFTDQQINGVLVFIAKAERQDLIVGDQASRAFFPSGSFAHIHDAMRGYFREGDFDGGVTAGVGLIIDGYRSHERAATAGQQQSQPVAVERTATRTTGGSHMGNLVWLIIILLAGFLIIRAIFRMMSAPRIPPQGPGGPPMAGPGYGPGFGGPGYGGGYGGGGGSFFSGLLGGLGGAWLGNEMFGGRGGSTPIGGPADAAGGSFGAGGAPDSTGWQADPGQADMGNAGGGDWSSGGGFDAGGGGGFDGGGGGFDGGGGGGDGGGW